MRVVAAVGRSANAKDEHGKRKDDEEELNMLAVDLAGQNGELGNFGIHSAFPLNLRLGLANLV
jgi:hypothetical protein